MIKYNCSVDNAGSINKLNLNYGTLVEDLKSHFHDMFVGKCIISLEVIENLHDSRFLYGDGEVISFKSFSVNGEVEVALEVEGFNSKCKSESFVFDENDGKYIHIISILDTPLIAKSEVKNDKAMLLDQVKINRFYILVCDESLNTITSVPNKRFLESYSEMGFMIVDINAFDSFLKTRNTTISNNLIEEFTTTELANELFDEGLMILCWGNTPWVYYMSSINDDSSQRLTLGMKTAYTGTYKLKESIKSLSVIPGNLLTDWNSCKEKDWPKLSIEGVGGYVTIELYVNLAMSQSDSDYPIPTFNISRIKQQCLQTEPLLSSSIF